MTTEIKQLPLSEGLKKKIYEGFARHAISMIGHNEIHKPVAFIANDQENFAGAVVVDLFWGALHIKYVYVEDEYRGQGIGTQLMEKAFQYGRENQCPFAFVETMSFQASDFYQKIGFQLEFTRSGYKYNTAFHYLRKNLSKEQNL
ncbi:MAG: GNAT family N-acetyltransferase [Chlamydiota bacterium]|jgi:ribosomal protein S18 acetylase RimI-like enzyme